ncbi:hypothetical protein HFO41_15390 [Rhizobium leguminosarum]|uniref:hypothetical protein n=1 Tax=Rhizobium leguminosarum TaxID=384 RepID=UPI001A938830|nr:hypothetical protein [Rhizobium leguminosarum]MBY5557706.1 hypothetical protein [Rhizobium leguminosarum]MBY5638261.1 hypothetical protein [Rhizobium leguminosarum]MBY5690196.1 hypothetical protein [Rhizobium leguminosarum]MBY5722473.1 hypothetical protein [Rhizobium leguminosarum]QSW22740.1 hypothetical protein J0664_18425 [Rhizobium leguminosarum]
MGLDRKLIQAAFLGGVLAMPALAHSAEISAEEALLARISAEAIPKMQREYLQATLPVYGTVIDLGAYLSAAKFDHWYVEDVFDGVPFGPHAPIPDEEVVLTGALFELWQFSPIIPYYLEVTEIPDCTAMLPASCGWLPLTLTLSP